jgi:TolB-like protein/Flp pilus assembly protein TadD
LSLISELRRRRVFRVAILYVIGAWAVLQASDLAFPGLEIPESAIRYVWIWAFACFPLALVVGWRFDIVSGSIVRTPASATDQYPAINRTDYAVLSVVTAVALVISFSLLAKIMETRSPQPNRVSTSNIDSQSIAVLPFTNMSGDDSNDPFTMGIHDDVLTHISKISGIKVISRTSVTRLDTSMSVPDIGELLQVATVLEGGMQRMEDRVRINVQLIDTATDQHLWAESFDRELTTQNIFDIQSEIAAAITASLQATLSPRDEANLNKIATLNLEAFEAYILGKQQMINRTAEGLLKAVEYFDTAIELDPQYALAYVGLADATLLLNTYGFLPLDEMLEITEPALSTALLLDDQLGAVYASVGLGRNRQGDPAGAIEAFIRAIELDPNYATPYHWYGDTLLNNSGDLETALALLEKARELDPLSPVIHTTMGEIFEGLGKFDEALAFIQKAIEIEPDFPGAYIQSAIYYRFVLGRIDEAVRWYSAELTVAPLRNTSSLGLAYLDLGDTEKAAYWIDKALERHPEWFIPRSDKVFLHRYLGEEEQALEAARQLLATAPGNNTTLVTLVNYGKYEEAIELFMPAFPELACNIEPTITRINLFQAINLSLALEETGERQCADRMLEKILEQMEKMSRFGGRGYGIADVEIYARQGKTRLALDTLRQAIDNGWRAVLWAQGEGSPHMVNLLEEPEFKAMMAEVKEDLDAQLARVRQMEANGELALIPEVGSH